MVKSPLSVRIAPPEDALVAVKAQSSIATIPCRARIAPPPEVVEVATVATKRQFRMVASAPSTRIAPPVSAEQP